jgi:hypothetical protein
LVATLLTLLFLPALYVAWFRVKEPVPGEHDRDARSAKAMGGADPRGDGAALGY